MCVCVCVYTCLVFCLRINKLEWNSTALFNMYNAVKRRQKTINLSFFSVSSQLCNVYSVLYVNESNFYPVLGSDRCRQGLNWHTHTYTHMCTYEKKNETETNQFLRESPRSFNSTYNVSFFLLIHSASHDTHIFPADFLRVQRAMNWEG